MNLRAVRWSRRSTIVAAIVAATVVGGGVAYAATAQPAIKTFTPRVADQVTNVDVLRQQIRNYYGDPLGTGTFAPDGNYAKETSRVAAEGSRWLKAMHAKKGMTKAIVLDVELMLGLILSRYLHRPQDARPHLEQALARVHTQRDRELAQAELDHIRKPQAP